MLSSEQEKKVRLKILDCGIHYYEVYQELCDHYFSAIEDRMRTGVTFQAALVDTHTQFGKEEGLKRLQKSFASSAVKHYRTLHWKEFKQRFNWPHVLYIILAAALGYGLTDLLAPKMILIGLFLLSIVPFFLIVLTEQRMKGNEWNNHVFIKKTLRGMALRQQGIIVMSLFNVVFLGSNVVFGDEQVLAALNQIHQAFLTGLVVFVFVWSWSFFVTVRNTRPKLT